MPLIISSTNTKEPKCRLIKTAKSYVVATILPINTKQLIWSQSSVLEYSVLTTGSGVYTKPGVINVKRPS